MLRSRYEEIKFLRTSSFQRPITSNYLANSKAIRCIRKVTIPKNLNINTLSDKPVLAQTFNTQKNQMIKISKNFTPDASRGRIKTPMYSNKSITKERDALNLATEISEIGDPPYKNSDFLYFFKPTLSKHELSEIVDYPIIYYWGQNYRKDNNT